MTMRRDDVIRLILARRDGAIIAATYLAAFDLMRLGPDPLNYLSIGAMGQASSHALGLALGRPDKKVIVLDGDGSLLMNLGSLATIAGAAPANLVHFVFHNGCYEANGSHLLPGGGSIDFAMIARGAGIADATNFDDIGSFSAALPGLLSRPGPVFASLAVVAGDPSPLDYDFIHGAETRRRFREALAAR